MQGQGLESFRHRFSKRPVRKPSLLGTWGVGVKQDQTLPRT